MTNNNPAFAERVWLHRHAYGTAIRIPRRAIQIALTIVCLITPGTNWALVFVRNIKDVVWRF